MPALIPKLIATEVQEEANELLLHAQSYLSEEDARFIEMMDRARASIKANAGAAYSAMSVIYQLSGNAEQSIYCIDNAIKLQSSEPSFRINRVVALTNLGFFSDCLLDFRKVADPADGFLTFLWNNGYVMGAFTTMRTFFEAANTMGLDMTGLDTRTALQAAAVLDQFKVPEEEVAKLLNVAGSILRKHKLFFVGTNPNVLVCIEPGIQPFIRVGYKVGVSREAAHAMYLEYIDQVLELGEDVPDVVSVCFISEESERGRKAA